MTEILLDYDHEPPRDLLHRWAFVRRWLKLVRSGPMVVTRTKRGWHVRAGVCGQVEPSVVVAVQAIMGSDWKRETYNLVRARGLARAPAFWRQQGRWNVLYARKLEG